MIVECGGIAWHVETAGHPASSCVLLLHGFTGTWETWREVVAELSYSHFLIMPDLPGHGKTPPVECGLWHLADSLAGLVRHFTEQRIVLCGYSMGGRIAMHLALAHPQRVDRLALVAASPGIESVPERANRARADAELADQLLQNGQEWFTSYWEDQPIFATLRALPEEKRKEIRRVRLSYPVDGLASALRHWSVGVQDFLLPRLREINMPVLLLAGELDEKYAEINRRMRSALLNAAVTAAIIPRSGHAIVWENPRAFIDELSKFLQ